MITIYYRNDFETYVVALDENSSLKTLRIKGHIQGIFNNLHEISSIEVSYMHYWTDDETTLRFIYYGIYKPILSFKSLHELSNIKSNHPELFI